VLGAGEGEHLIHFRDAGSIFIKVDPLKGANNLALGTQQLPIGSGIPVHRHFHMDEAFYFLEGGGSFTLNEVERYSYPRTRGMVLAVRSGTGSAVGYGAPRPRPVLPGNL
jgi:mannose-6-phosphate isomerase-like protein (cupin superfamily)